MFAAALITTLLLFAGWFALLYRFHRSLQALDPALSQEIGEPSWFWTAFNGHSHLVRLMRRPDLAHSRYAPLTGQARLLVVGRWRSWRPWRGWHGRSSTCRWPDGRHQ